MRQSPHRKRNALFVVVITIGIVIITKLQTSKENENRLLTTRLHYEKVHNFKELGKAVSNNSLYENVIVHLDLKGAPPKVPYFIALLELLKKSGATGILIEWEDMFPFTGKLKNARNADAYSLEEVKQILGKAKSLGLDIIPLVQTFAHLEWILKLEENRKYRAMDEFPQVLCLSNEEAVALVEDALGQVISVHADFGIPLFHIGCDEAFTFGVCREDQEWMHKQIPEHGNKEMLVLTHIKRLAEFVKLSVKEEVTVLVWYDMLQKFNGIHIKATNLSSFVEPVIWDYSEKLVSLNGRNLQPISKNFPVVWASSAYKGANSPSEKYIDIGHYETNNRAWINSINSNLEKFGKFRGIIITGWQRFDHMAGLCEILPVGTPSMVLSVETALSAARITDQQGIRSRAAHKLNCTGGEMYVHHFDLISTYCNFPGWLVYATLQRDVRLTIADVNQQIKYHAPTSGWLNKYNMMHNIGQNWYLRKTIVFLRHQKQKLLDVKLKLRQSMNEIFYHNTVEEFMLEIFGEHIDRIDHLLREAGRLANLRMWKRRYFYEQTVRDFMKIKV